MRSARLTQGIRLRLSLSAYCRMALPWLAAAMTCAPLAGARAAAAPDPHDLSGVWWTQSYGPKIDPGVTAVVFTPASQAAYQKNMAGLKDGSIADAARKTCTPDGVPRV